MYTDLIAFFLNSSMQPIKMSLKFKSRPTLILYYIKEIDI